MSNVNIEIERLRPQIRMLFKISTELENAFPGRKFTLDGHLLGSIGEVIASYHYELKLLTSSSERHDAISKDGHLVQIKATQGSRHISLRSEPEYLIVLWINGKTGEAKEIYNGPGACVWEACYKLSSNGTRSITISRLKQLSLNVPDNQRIIQIIPFPEDN